MAIERIEPGSAEWELFYANHIVRYEFADRVIGEKKYKTILDVACGVGYGTFLLAVDPLRKICGIDLSERALSIAKDQFSTSNIDYLQGDCEELKGFDFPEKFDAIVSFETLEHLKRPKDFLEGCYARLKSGGMIIISTPNQDVSSPDGNLNWEFHEKEYNAEEFESLLRQVGFHEMTLYGQQLTQAGILRAEIRGELNRILSNPFLRAGRYFQKLFRGRKFVQPLPERATDFEIIPYADARSIKKLGKAGPLVTIAVAHK